MGTEGADVIVTNGETRVDALGGDDLVCATIEDGVGYNPVFAILGAGADTFTASDGGSHTIFAGTADGTDTEADVIDLAFGEVSWSGIQTAPGAVSVATGGILGVRSADGDVTMDASGTVTGVDTKLTWTGQFDRLVFITSAERGRFTFRGTSGTEHVKGDGGREGLDPRARLRRPHRDREARRRHRHQPREQGRRHRVPDDDRGHEGPRRSLRRLPVPRPRHVDHAAVRRRQGHDLGRPGQRHHHWEPRQ